MFAMMFNLGIEELLILAVLGLLTLGVFIAVVLAVVFINRRKEGDESREV